VKQQALVTHETVTAFAKDKKMLTPMRIVMAAGVVLATTLFTSLAHAQTENPDPRWQPLRENAQIEEGLLLIMVGTFIVENCDAIDVRRARSTPYMIGLATRAMALGYSRSSVEAFIEDPIQGARVEARARE